MDELKAMRTLAQVVDSGSFAQASRDLSVAPAVITRVVADLERRLGVRLMTRTTRRNALTHIGQRYLERVRPILRDVDEATALARQSQAQASGHVRVLAPPAFAAQQLARRLSRFHGKHPQITVEVTATGPVEQLDEGQDISIVVRQSALDGDFIARRLARSQVIACATPAYLDRHGRPTHPKELERHPLLMPALQSAQRQVTFRRLARGHARAETVAPARPPLQSGNHEIHHASALAGVGIAGLPSFAVESSLREDRLEQVLPDWHLADLSIWACMPSQRHLPASTRAFMDFLLSEFDGADVDPWIPDRAGAVMRRACA